MATISASPQVVSDRLRRPRRSVNFQAPPVVTRPTAPAETCDATERLWDIAALRWACAVASVFVLALVGFALAPNSSATAPALSSSAGPVVVESSAMPAWTVAPGDTLWSIATQVSAGDDPREVVMQLQRINGFGPGHVLQVGEVVLVQGDRPLGRS